MKKFADFFLLILISVSLTYLYIDTFLFGTFFAYLSVFFLVILWTFLLFYFYSIFSEKPETVAIGNEANQQNIPLFLVHKEKIDYKKITYSVLGFLFSLLIVLIVHTILDKEWALASFAVVFGIWGTYIYENWIKK